MANETFSTHRTTVAGAGVHRFKVAGHSLGNAPHVTSKPFRVAGHDWAVRYYYPSYDVLYADEDDPDDPEEYYAGVYLVLLNAGDDRQVTAAFSFCLQADPAAPPPATEEKQKQKQRYYYLFCSTNTFSSTKPVLGCRQFFSLADLDASGCLRDDCLVIKCTVEVITSKLVDGDDDDGGGRSSDDENCV